MGKNTLVKGVFLLFPCGDVRVATTEDEHFFGTLFGVCFFYWGDLYVEKCAC